MPKYKSERMPSAVRKFLYNLLKKNRFKSVEINFSGGGDDGGIEDIDVVPDGMNSVLEEVIHVSDESYKMMMEIQGFHRPSMVAKDSGKGNLISIYRLICCIMQPWIQDAPTDWVNNSGGRGSCTLEINDEKLLIKISSFEYVVKEGPEFTSTI